MCPLHPAALSVLFILPAFLELEPGAAWTGCKSITGPHRGKLDRQSFSLSPGVSLALAINLTCLWHAFR